MLIWPAASRATRRDVPTSTAGAMARRSPASPRPSGTTPSASRASRGRRSCAPTRSATPTATAPPRGRRRRSTPRRRRASRSRTCRSPAGTSTRRIAGGAGRDRQRPRDARRRLCGNGTLGAATSTADRRPTRARTTSRTSSACAGTQSDERQTAGTQQLRAPPPSTSPRRPRACDRPGATRCRTPPSPAPQRLRRWSAGAPHCCGRRTLRPRSAPSVRAAGRHPTPRRRDQPHPRHCEARTRSKWPARLNVFRALASLDDAPPEMTITAAPPARTNQTASACRSASQEPGSTTSAAWMPATAAAAPPAELLGPRRRRTRDRRAGDRPPPERRSSRDRDVRRAPHHDDRPRGRDRGRWRRTPTSSGPPTRPPSPSAAARR